MVVAANLSRKFRNIPLARLCPYGHQHFYTLLLMLDLLAYSEAHLPVKTVSHVQNTLDV